ncbi:MAG: hypothetical protein QOG59_2428, partial [Solirubrobacteraceae bacterium]|nr:hypothetical protein [Solirubrobacteraceae bacterium]
GELFRLNLNGTLTVLHSFTTTNRIGGYSPNSDLIQGQDGALYGATGIGGATGSGTIFRYDQSIPGPVASISVNPSAVVYPDRSTGTVTLSAPAPAGGTTVSLFAQQGQIVIPSTVTIPAGASRASFSIQTMSIMASTNVRIYAAVAGQGVRTTIRVLPAPKLSSLTLTPTSVRGSQTSTGTVRLSGPTPSSGAVVTLASNSPLASTVRSVKVAGGATSATFTITTQPVSQSSPVTISASYNGTQKSAVLTILP